MTWYQEWFGEDYLDLYAYRDEQEARQQVAFCASHFGKMDGPILDLACGKGRHIVELQALGYRTTGCDLSYTLLRTGRLEYGPLPLARADMRRLPYGSGSFHALVNFFTSFGYFSDEAENVAVLEEMSRVLTPGALFLFDYLNLRRELQKLVQRETKETARGPVYIERWFDPADRSFNKRITIGSKRYLERVRGYDLPELSEMFSRCGLEVREAFGDFAGSAYDETSPRLIVVGEKR
ncbi:MAG TPA: methyltransferase domain-containing protein [Thermoanaerobaculia bacterium]|nr:methyltransferase domain-containing protein [Thermoanaerobaculia bacterium]